MTPQLLEIRRAWGWGGWGKCLGDSCPGGCKRTLVRGGDTQDFSLSRWRSGTRKAFPDQCSLPMASWGRRLQALEVNLVSHILTLYHVNHVFYFLCF